MTVNTTIAGRGARAPRRTHRGPHRAGPLRRRQYLTAYLFVAPSVIILCAFMVWPMLSSLRLSFYDSSQFGPSTFAGLDNYRSMLADPTFRGDLWRTLLYAIVVTPVTVGLALMFAVMLHRRMHGRSFFCAALFVPAVLSLGVMSIAWSYLLDPRIGLLPHWLEPLGVDFGNGIADPHRALAYVMAVGVWKNVGFYMVMYLAGLDTIPRDLYEAADVDGVSPFQRFRHITWPLLANTSAFVFVIAGIAALQAFDQVFVMTRGGPYFQTETLVYLLYREGFQNFRFGSASAVAWVLVIIVFIVSIIQNTFFARRQVTY